LVLKFRVQEQTISALPTKSEPRIGSKEYLQLMFSFSDDWKNLRKTVYLQSEDVSLPIECVGNCCNVPEYFTEQSSFNVTLFGNSDGVEVPTNVVTVTLSASNTLWESDAPTPTPSWFADIQESADVAQQFYEEASTKLEAGIAHIDASVTVTEDNKQATLTAQETATTAAMQAGVSATDASTYAQLAGDSARVASEAERTASDASVLAQQNASSAGSSATLAATSADIASNAEVKAVEAKDVALQALSALLLTDEVTGKLVQTECAASMQMLDLSVQDSETTEKVIVLGKNFFPNDVTSGIVTNGVTVTYDAETQEFVFNGTTVASGDVKIDTNLALPWVVGDKYAMSVVHTGGTAVLAAGSGITFGWSIFSKDAKEYYRGSLALEAFPEVYSFSGSAIAESGGSNFIFYLQCWRKGTVFDNYRVKVQIETGTVVTDYEPSRKTVAQLADYKSIVLAKGFNNITTRPMVPIAVKYALDTKLYFDAKLAELQGVNSSSE
jgi:hypothetical protein